MCHYCKKRQNYSDSEVYCKMLMSVEGPEKEEASKIYRDIQVPLQNIDKDSINASTSSIDETSFTF